MKLYRILTLSLAALMLAATADAQVSVRRTSKKSEATASQSSPKNEKPSKKDSTPKPSAKPASPASGAAGAAAANRPGKPASQSSAENAPAKTTPTRKTTPSRKSGTQASAVNLEGKTLRQRSFDEYQKESQEETPWQHIVYREIDLKKDQNASLYFPIEPMDGLTNCFRVIIDAFAKGELPAYEYLDGREVFNDKYKVKVTDLLDKFQVYYQVESGGKNGGDIIKIDESDVPSSEVQSYYVKERWEFDQKHSLYKPRILAICPVLHRSGDFGGSVVKYPLFWLNFEDVRPFLRDHLVVSSGMNTAPRFTMEEFFTLNMYDGTIYKEQNLRGLTLMQQYPNADSLKMAQQQLNDQLKAFGDSIWEEEPVLEEKTGKKAKKEARKASDEKEVKAAEEAQNSESAGRQKNRRTKEPVDREAAAAEKEAKRTTKRSARR